MVKISTQTRKQKSFLCAVLDAWAIPYENRNSKTIETLFICGDDASYKFDALVAKFDRIGPLRLIYYADGDFLIDTKNNIDTLLSGVINDARNNS